MIRKAEFKDYEALERLLLEVELVHHEIRPDIFRNGGIKFNSKILEEMINDELSPIFVYEQDGDVVAYMMCYIRKSDTHPIFNPYKILFIEDLSVDKRYRHMGIGRKLMDYIKDYSKEIGLDRIELHVWNHNDNAIRFYESYGFTVQGMEMEMKL